MSGRGPTAVVAAWGRARFNRRAPQGIDQPFFILTPLRLSLTVTHTLSLAHTHAGTHTLSLTHTHTHDQSQSILHYLFHCKTICPPSLLPSPVAASAGSVRQKSASIR